MASIDTRSPQIEEDRTWWLSGWHLDHKLAAKTDTDGWCERNTEAKLVMTVADNGAHCDGLWLKIEVVNFEGEGPSPNDLVEIRLSPKQAEILALALSSAVLMRKTGMDKFYA